MKYIAFIPARGGSKGILKKNIKTLCGKPLIAWSIEQALNSKLIDKVVVSTDSPEISVIAQQYGAEAPFLRPASISDDSAKTESAMIHFCNWAVERGIDFDNLILIQATSPIRSQNRFDQAIKYFEDSGCDSLLTVTRSHRFFWKNPKSPSPNYDYTSRPRRQDILPDDIQYMETGSFYISKRDGLLREENRLFGNICMYETPEEESYEIDSLVDFRICETLMQNLTKDL
jgi:N-acylneuraminate cytidylyltransferase